MLSRHIKVLFKTLNVENRWKKYVFNETKLD